MKKNFILGVGCQKGGTSWLHSQLSKSKNVDMGFIKEYHVFDALYVPECEKIISRKREKLKNKLNGGNNLSKESHLLTHFNFYLNTDNYFDYFDYLWYKGGDLITTVGDITPTYLLLPPVALKSIKIGLEKRGFNVKVVFLLRDPIERCWSMMRMSRKNQLRSNPKIILPDEQQQLEIAYKTKQCEIRTRYEKAIKNYELVFNSNDIFYGFYETLFEPKSIRKLKSFLQISDFEPDINQRVNVSKKNNSLQKLNVKLEKEIFNHYKSTYEFCEKRFGIKEYWNGSKFL